MNNMINIEISKESAMEIKKLLLEKIRFINSEVSKYGNIISKYVANLDYKSDVVTYQQAWNCAERYGEEFKKYNDILCEIQKYTQE